MRRVLAVLTAGGVVYSKGSASSGTMCSVRH
jgi:hypothetical protein